jgi:hypothetical protein
VKRRGLHLAPLAVVRDPKDQQGAQQSEQETVIQCPIKATQPKVPAKDLRFQAMTSSSLQAAPDVNLAFERDQINRKLMIFQKKY